jgi:hypothetical protein
MVTTRWHSGFDPRPCSRCGYKPVAPQSRPRGTLAPRGPSPAVAFIAIAGRLTSALLPPWHGAIARCGVLPLTCRHFCSCSPIDLTTDAITPSRRRSLRVALHRLFRLQPVEALLGVDHFDLRASTTRQALPCDLSTSVLELP